MGKTNKNLNSSAAELINGSKVRSEMKPQCCHINPYDQENSYHNKSKVSFDDQFQNIVDDLLKFQTNHVFQAHTSDVELILRQCEWTDILMRILEYGNTHILLSHKYRIVMED